MQAGYSDLLIETLQHSGVSIIKTDTIYGIVGRANNRETVERIYRIKQRTPSKSPIILIGDMSQMFDQYSPSVLATLANYWPGPNSLILPSQKAPDWITRENTSVAYRLPDNEQLCNLIKKTGPLIAPSANPEGMPPATSIDEARKYFGDLVDHYEDGGVCSTQVASSLFKIDGDAIVQLR